ncbi:MAG: Hpt domain-containing protein [Phycisphaerales bacterium]
MNQQHNTGDSHTQTDARSGEPIRSTLASNTDMGELIEWFVNHLDQRTADMTEAWQRGDLERLRTVAHQMKGSSAGFGFEILGRAAGELESLLIDHESAEGQLDAVRRRLDDLLGLCSRAIV